MPSNLFHLIRLMDLETYVNRIYDNDSYKSFLAFVLDSVIEGIITVESAKEWRTKATNNLDNLKKQEWKTLEKDLSEKLGGSL